MRLSIVLFLVACSSTNSDGPGSDPDAGPSSDGAQGEVPITETATEVTVANSGIELVFDKATGTSSFKCSGIPAISGAYASVDLGGPGGYLKSTGYATHTFTQGDVEPVHDGFGDGVRVPVVHAEDGKPTIRQTYTFYPSHPGIVFVDEAVESPTPISSNYLGTLIVDSSTGFVAAPDNSDPRLLDVPFDNDNWVRFDSRKMGPYDFNGTSYEMTALYDGKTNAGFVVGSVTHDFWKTGIYYNYSAAKHQLTSFNVWGGAGAPDKSPLSAGATYGGDGTHDVAAHGKQTGTTLTSPRIFVGCFSDWRAGLESFGAANATIAPPKTWSGGSPFGWMSWGAYGTALPASRVMDASDFLKTMPAFTSSGGVYVNIDAGLKADARCATAACVAKYIHDNGQRAGTYRVPFSYFGTNLDQAIGGTAYTYNDVILRDDAGQPIRRHNAYMLDPTHPGTKKLIHDAITSVVTDGFDLVKLDFLTDGAMEGKHYDPDIHTGMQAYNQAMAYINSLLPPEVFISESIAPMFPSQYAHARRISTDVVGQLADDACPSWPHYGSTEYMLNAVTFGWWMQGTLYPYNDPDSVALVAFAPSKTATFPELWAKTHVTASAIAGTMFFDSTDTASTMGADRARKYLTNAAVDEIAAAGRSFRPLDGAVGFVNASSCDGQGSTNSGARAAQLFERREPDGAILIAAFDYGPGSTLSLDVTRLGFSGTAAYDVLDVWSGTKTTKTGTLSIQLAAGDSKLLRLAPQ